MKPAALLLLAPLTLASIGFPATLQQQASPASVWRSQKTPGGQGPAHTQFILAGKFVTAPQGEVSHPPTMVVDCIPGKNSHKSKGHFVSANLLAGTTLKIDYVEPEEIHGTSYFPKVSVRYRIDDAKEEEEKWPPGASKTSASIPKDSLKKLLRAHIVEISADDDSGSHVVMHFDMPDPAAVEQTCNVDEHSK
jgi:hypothetical protein